MAQTREITESWDLYPAANGQAGYGVYTVWLNTTGQNAASLVAGRFGGQALQLLNNNGVQRPIPSTTQLVINTAFKWNSGVGACDFIRILSTNGNTQFIVRCNVVGQVQFVVNGVVVATSGSQEIFPSVYHFGQLALNLSDSVGTASFKMDGFEVLAFAGDTKGHADADIGRVQFWAMDGGTWQFDDTDVEIGGLALHVESRLETRPANSDVSNTGFTQSTGATIFGVVDEVPANSSDWASATLAASEFRVGFADLTTNPETILGVQVINLSQKDEAGTRTLRNRLLSGAVTYDGAEQPCQLNSFTFKQDWLPLNPDGTVAWVAASVNALTGGAQIVI